MPAAMTEVIPKSPQIAIRWVCTSPLVVAPQMKKVPKRIQKVSDRETPLSTSSGDTSIAANEPGSSGSHVTSLAPRSEEHTSELQSLMRISYAVFCLKKKTNQQHETITDNEHTQHRTIISSTQHT